MKCAWDKLISWSLEHSMNKGFGSKGDNRKIRFTVILRKWVKVCRAENNTGKAGQVLDLWRPYVTRWASVLHFMENHWKDLNFWFNWISHLPYLSLPPLWGERTQCIIYPWHILFWALHTSLSFLKWWVLHKCFPGNWKCSGFCGGDC